MSILATIRRSSDVDLRWLEGQPHEAVTNQGFDGIGRLTEVAWIVTKIAVQRALVVILTSQDRALARILSDFDSGIVIRKHCKSGLPFVNHPVSD